jgi:tetratricopeptide (TPR) repeat protein
MRLTVIITLLLAITPSANAANTGGGSAPAPAPVATSTPTPTPTQAAQTPTPAAVKTVNSELAKVTTLLNANNFKQALADLKIIDSEFKNNADVNNLLGYSSRKLKQYKPAATYYEKALKLNPNHLGALEYQGELFVLTNKVSAAKKNLVKLEKLCGLKCGEYLDLKKAIGKKFASFT